MITLLPGHMTPAPSHMIILVPSHMLIPVSGHMTTLHILVPGHMIANISIYSEYSNLAILFGTLSLVEKYHVEVSLIQRTETDRNYYKKNK